MVHVWVAGKVVVQWLTLALSELFREKVLYNRVLYKLPLL